MAITMEYLFNISGLQTLIAKCLTPSGSEKQTDCFLANSQIDVTDNEFYSTIALVSSVKQGTSKKQIENDKEEVTSVYITTYSVQIIGKSAILWASRLDASLRTSSSLSELRNLGIGILLISPIRDLSLSIDGGYEQRSQIDITVSQRTTLTSDHNEMKSVDIKMESEK